MSRIDKAIEQAAQKRQSAADAATVATSSEKRLQVDTEGMHGEASMVKDPQYHAFDAVPTPIVRNPFLVTASTENGPVAEQYRKLKSAIVKLAQLKSFDKSLMVTSAIGGEGKTITSLNLAITLAQEFDHTVLLVEADIRRPTIMKYLELEATKGLADCALDGVDVSEVLVKTGIGKLSILPAGRMVPNPVELFSSNRMQSLLNEIKTRYVDRYVIVDTTPLLPFAEPQFIAGVMGGVLLVVREGYTSVDKVAKAVSLLENYNLLGVVSNAVSKVNTGDKNGYYGYYGYE